MSELEIIKPPATKLELTPLAPKVVEVNPTRGLPGPVGPSGLSESLRASAVLSALRVVKQVSDGVDYADPATAFLAIGITESAASLGAQVLVRRGGSMEDSNWAWTPGAPIFLGVGGVLTQTPPASGVVLMVAVAVTATMIRIQFQTPVQQV